MDNLNNSAFFSRENSLHEYHTAQPSSSSSSSTFSSSSSSNFSSSPPLSFSSSKNNRNFPFKNDFEKYTERYSSNSFPVNNGMNERGMKMSVFKTKNPSFDEESEADSGIADSIESPAVKGKKKVWTLATLTKTRSPDLKKCNDTSQETNQETNLKIKSSKTNESLSDNRTSKLQDAMNYSKEQRHGGAVVRSAVLCEEEREGKYERKYNSSTCLRHKNHAKKNRIKQSMVRSGSEGGSERDDGKMSARGARQVSSTPKQNGKLSQTPDNYKRQSSTPVMMSWSTQKDPSRMHRDSSSNSKSPVRRELFSCPEESELDQSLTSSLNISTLQRFSSVDPQRKSRSDVWKSIFKSSQRLKADQNNTLKSESMASPLNSSFDNARSYANVRLTPLKQEGAFVKTEEAIPSGGLFHSLSRIFKRNKRKTYPHELNNTLPPKMVPKRQFSEGGLASVSEQRLVSRSSSETTLNNFNNVSICDNSQKRLETERFHADKHSLNSSKVALLSSKYSGASCMRQALVDLNRWNSLFFTYTSLLPNNFSNQDFIAKRSAFKRSTKTLVINIKNTLVNYQSSSFVDCVRLSCCISYADVVSCCCFMLDFISLPKDRKRLTDTVSAVGRTFHATVSSSPAYMKVYNKNHVFDEQKAHKFFENVQTVIENSKKLAFVIDSVGYKELTMKF